MVRDEAPLSGTTVWLDELPSVPVAVGESDPDPELDPDPEALVEEAGETTLVDVASESELEVAVEVCFEVAVPVAVPEDEEVELGVSKVSGQVRLKRGVVERLLVIAKLCLLAPFESRRLYQKVGVLLKRRRQPTSCQ